MTEVKTIAYDTAKDLSHDVNSSEVFDEQYIEWFKNSAHYDEKNTTTIPVKFSED